MFKQVFGGVLLVFSGLMADPLIEIVEGGAIKYHSVVDEQGRAYTRLQELQAAAASGDQMAMSVLDMLNDGTAKINAVTGVIYQP